MRVWLVMGGVIPELIFWECVNIRLVAGIILWPAWKREVYRVFSGWMLKIFECFCFMQDLEINFSTSLHLMSPAVFSQMVYVRKMNCMCVISEILNCVLIFPPTFFDCLAMAKIDLLVARPLLVTSTCVRWIWVFDYFASTIVYRNCVSSNLNVM